MDVLRTSDDRFENLAGFPFAPHYVGVTAADTEPLRMHYVDAGPSDGPPIVLLHGEPTWSYLYRTMIAPLATGGFRVLAPDLIGFGRSDKPAHTADYTYLRHVEWVTSWFTALDLRNTTIFVQDWGSLVGLRIAASSSPTASFRPDRHRPTCRFGSGVPSRVARRCSPPDVSSHWARSPTYPRRIRCAVPRQAISSRGPRLSRPAAD